MRAKMVNGHVVLLPCFVFLWLRLSHGADTLAAGSVMKDWEFLVSPNNVFKFGFFNPIFSGNRYLGIQYMNYSELKLVWVANRENPLTDSSGYLNITNDGNLVLHDQRGTSITANYLEQWRTGHTRTISVWVLMIAEKYAGMTAPVKLMVLNQLMGPAVNFLMVKDLRILP